MKHLTDEELKSRHCINHRQIMYHEAAEGEQYYQESLMRAKAKEERKALCDEFRRRGLEIPRYNLIV